MDSSYIYNKITHNGWHCHATERKWKLKGFHWPKCHPNFLFSIRIEPRDRKWGMRPGRLGGTRSNGYEKGRASGAEISNGTKYPMEKLKGIETAAAFINGRRDVGTLYGRRIKS